nr:hypothetical protein [Tanacetum cinerariifolium]
MLWLSGSNNEDANEHIDKVLDIVDLFNIPNITQDQVMLRAFPMLFTRAVLKQRKPSKRWPSILKNDTMEHLLGCKLCKGPHYTKGCPLKEEGKVLEEAYYTQFGMPFPQGRQYRPAALGFYQRNNGNPSYQVRRQTMEESLSKFLAESAKRHEENSNLNKEIRASTDAAIRNQGASIKALEIQIRQMSKVLKERGSRNLPTSIKVNPRDHVKSFSTVLKLIRPRYAVLDPADTPYWDHRTEGSYGLKNSVAYSIRTTLLDDALPTKEKDPGSFILPCIINNWCFNKALADLGASVSVMPFSTYTKLRISKLAPTKLIVELADRTVKRPKGIVENVLVRIDKFVFPVDFVVLDMPKYIKTPLII